MYFYSPKAYSGWFTISKVINAESPIICNLGEDSTPNEVIPNMTPKTVTFHSTALKTVRLN